MSLYYITGIAGTGKSSIKKELVRRGYEAHEGDEPHITVWRNINTGEAVEKPERQEDRTDEWYSDHQWAMSADSIKEIAKSAKDKPVFVCGTSSNRYDLFSLFDKVICLTIDEETLKHRLATRSDNNFGQSPVELANILSWHKPSEVGDVEAGAVLVDATRPINEVVDEILDICTSGK